MAFTGIFPSSPSQIVPEGPLELVKCYSSSDHCGLLQLAHYFDPKVLFGDSYGYRSSLNISMCQHLQGLAQDISKYISFQPKDIVLDIGSNDGTFLNALCGQGLNLWGIDPLIFKFKPYYNSEIHTIGEFFSKEVIKAHFKERIKVVTAIAIFYDLNDPLKFLKDVKDLLLPEGIIVLELSYLPSMLKNTSYDTICHEHAAYYGAKQLDWLAQQAGLTIIDIQLNSINGGSIRTVLSKRDIFPQGIKAKMLTQEEEKQGMDSLKPYEDFRKRVFEHRNHLKETIQSFVHEGKKVAGYGASTKGNVILQFCDFSPNDIPWIAEVNEDKWGKFCPGTKIPIFSETSVKQFQPEVFLLLPWHLKETVFLKERDFLQKGGSFLLPFPFFY